MELTPQVELFIRNAATAGPSPQEARASVFAACAALCQESLGDRLCGLISTSYAIAMSSLIWVNRLPSPYKRDHTDAFRAFFDLGARRMERGASSKHDLRGALAAAQYAVALAREECERSELSGDSIDYWGAVDCATSGMLDLVKRQWSRDSEDALPTSIATCRYLLFRDWRALDEL